MPCGNGTVSLPLGPCTSTWPLCSAIFTPAGTGIGLRPIRDICSSLAPKNSNRLHLCSTGAQHAAPLQTQLCLPYLAENLAADFGFARGTSAHQAFWRRQNVDAQPANDRADIGCAEIAARAGARNALDAGDDAAAVRRVLQENAKHLARFVFVHHFEGRDVALFLQNACDFRFELRRGHVHTLVLGGSRIANARQKIGYGIRLHLFSCYGAACRGDYQLAFTTPGISPLSAIPRKQMRHIWNLRIYPRARPQTRQRLRTRTLNFGFLCVFAIFARRAIYCAPPGTRRGTPRPLRSSRPSSSFFAVVVSVTFMPLILSTRV